MRALFTGVHRYVGLITALFLFITGVTGAVISWDHELDDWLNPQLHEARSTGPAKPMLELVRLTEERHPEIRVSSMRLEAEAGENVQFGVQPRLNPATKKLYEPAFNQVFIDPVTGAEAGTRKWGAVWPITKETVVSFLYRLHYTLHLPEMWGIDRWGRWLLGVVAVLWTLDCFVGAYLTLPVKRRKTRTEADEALAGDEVTAPRAPVAGKSYWQRWKPAWKIRQGAGAYKLNFDLHRAVSLWTWGLLFLVAFTGFSLNLYREVFFPLMSMVSKTTPSVFDQRKPATKHQPIAPTYGFAEAIAKGQAEAKTRGWDEPAGSVFYSQAFGIYGVQFFRPEDDHGVGGVGHKRLYFDGVDGRYLGDRKPWTGTAADIFVQAQFPLHSGRILGIPGRILISLMGIVVAMLSVTGVYIWWKKRKARLKVGFTQGQGARAPARDDGGFITAK